jgi:hypothetical protein
MQTYIVLSLEADVHFLSDVEAWIDPVVERVYAVVDNLSTHSSAEVLLFNLLHLRWEFVFQPTYAAYLNLIEPWWKILKSLALKGRRGSRPGPRSSRPLNAPPPTGMSTSILSSGDAAGAIGNPAGSVSRLSH